MMINLMFCGENDIFSEELAPESQRVRGRHIFQKRREMSFLTPETLRDAEDIVRLYNSKQLNSLSHYIKREHRECNQEESPPIDFCR